MSEYFGIIESEFINEKGETLKEGVEYHPGDSGGYYIIFEVICDKQVKTTINYPTAQILFRFLKTQNMKLIDGIKLKGTPAKIPDCSRFELPEFFKEMGYKVGAEIGVYKGGFTEKFCQAGLKMYAIDPWISYYGDRNQERQNLIYKEACEKLAPYDCEIIRKSSVEAVRQFRNHSLDFVYIDGDHRFKQTAADIVDWNKKIRPGGVIAGHDYFTSLPWARKFRCQVGAIVDAYAKAFGINNFYTFGDLDSETEPEWGAWFLSWMFFKK